MSITLTPFTIAPLCQGHSWQISSEEALAEQIARVAVGQADHVARIFSGAGLAAPKTTHEAIQDAVEMLSVSPGGDPYHRDGWMFQVMSWIAAHGRSPTSLIRAPHMILAHKGLDGIEIEISADNTSVTAVIIFEDKATENPRAMVRDKVWPDFRLLEQGRQQNLIAAEVSSLLGAAALPNASEAIERIVWEDARRYRLSITVGNSHVGNDGLNRLFAEYDAVAPGNCERRLGETLHVQNLRPWMQQLAEQAINKAYELGA